MSLLAKGERNCTSSGVDYRALEEFLFSLPRPVTVSGLIKKVVIPLADFDKIFSRLREAIQEVEKVGLRRPRFVVVIEKTEAFFGKTERKYWFFEPLDLMLGAGGVERTFAPTESFCRAKKN